MMAQTKSIDSLVPDIQKLLVEGGDFPDEAYLSLGKAVAKCVKERMERPKLDAVAPKGGLRLSNIGKPDRQLWYILNLDREENAQEQLTPEQVFKFLYGSILEEVMLWLASASGHSVTNRQETVVVEGITGHIDCRIDGVGVDAKSASGQSFKTKFKQGSILRGDDPFGYLPQLGGYFGGEPDAAFFVSNKEDGSLLLFKVPGDSLPDTPARVRHIKEMAKLPEPPEKCYGTKDIGANKALRAGCKSCSFKTKCWENIRVFQYSDGIEYLVEVNNVPRVPELSLDAKTVINNIEEIPQGREWFVPKPV